MRLYDRADAADMTTWDDEGAGNFMSKSFAFVK